MSSSRRQITHIIYNLAMLGSNRLLTVDLLAKVHVVSGLVMKGRRLRIIAEFMLQQTDELLFSRLWT